MIINKPFPYKSQPPDLRDFLYIFLKRNSTRGNHSCTYASSFLRWKNVSKTRITLKLQILLLFHILSATYQFLIQGVESCPLALCQACFDPWSHFHLPLYKLFPYHQVNKLSQSKSKSKSKVQS